MRPSCGEPVTPADADPAAIEMRLAAIITALASDDHALADALAHEDPAPACLAFAAACWAVAFMETATGATGPAFAQWWSKIRTLRAAAVPIDEWPTDL